MDTENFGTQSAVVATAIITALLTTGLNWFWEEYRWRKQTACDDKVSQRRSQDWVDQQWWSRKEEAYSQIIGGLWQLLEHARKYQDFLYEETSREPAGNNEQYGELAKTRADLRRIADIGAFVISHEVADSLHRYFKRSREATQAHDSFAQIDVETEATHHCLNEVREAALRDLNIGQL